MLAEQEELLRRRRELQGGSEEQVGQAVSEGARLCEERAALTAEREALLGTLGPQRTEAAVPTPPDGQLDEVVLHVAQRCARLRAEIALLQEEGAQLRDWLDAAAGPQTTPTQRPVAMTVAMDVGRAIAAAAIADSSARAPAPSPTEEGVA